MFHISLLDSSGSIHWIGDRIWRTKLDIYWVLQLNVGCMLVVGGCMGTLGGNQQLQKSCKFPLQHSLKPGILPFWGAGVSEFRCYFWLRSYSVMFFSPFSLASYSSLHVVSVSCFPYHCLQLVCRHFFASPSCHALC